MIIEAIKDGDRYILPIKGEKERIKVEVLEEDLKDTHVHGKSIEDIVTLHYEEKRKNSIDETIDLGLFKKFLKVNNLEDK